MNEKHHEMTLQETHISGVEEWYCPDCGRRFLVQWPPAYKMIILEQGDKALDVLGLPSPNIAINQRALIA